MGIVVRQSIIATVVSYVGVAIGYFNMLWLFPMALSKSELGLFRVVQDLALLFVPFAQLGLAQGILKFYPPHKERKGFFSFLIFVSLICFAIFLVVFVIFRPYFIEWFAAESPEVNRYHFLLMACVLLLSLSATLETFSRSLLEIVIPSLIREILFRLGSSVLVMLYFLGIMKLDGVLYGLMLVYCLGIIILLFSIVRKHSISLKIDWKFADKSFLTPFIHYILITFIGGSGILIIARVDSFMVPGQLGLDMFAVYTVNFFIASVIEMPKRAISQISTPLISQAFMREDMANVDSIYKKVSIHQLVVGLLLFIGIWANLDNLYGLMANQDYAIGRWVVLWIGLGKLIDMTASVNGEIIIMSRYYIFNIVSALLLAVFTITANLFLIPIYGIEGASIAFALSMVVFNMVKFGFIYQKFDSQPFSWKTLFVIIAGVGIYFLSAQIPQLNPFWLDLLIRSTFITLLYVLAIYLINPSIEIRNLYNMAVAMVISKKQ